MMDRKRALSKLASPIRVGYNLSSALRIRKSFRMRVLLYHGVDVNEIGDFAKQLDFLAKTWKFISPADFEMYLQGNLELDQDSLMLTFDDGFKSQRDVVEAVLNPRGITAIFFIVTEYAKLDAESNWRGFISTHIWPGLEKDSIPNHWRNMDMADLNFLISTGHTIGCHSAKHERLSEIEPARLHECIIQAGEQLEQLTGQPVKHFAYPFGNLESFNSLALEVTRSQFEYIYTGMRGNNSLDTNRWEIRRDSFEPSDRTSWLSVVLDGLVDWKYRKNLVRFRSWGAD